MPASVTVDRARTVSGAHSILFWLRLLVLVCVLPAWALTTGIIVAYGLRERSAQEQGMVAMARALTQAVDRELESSVTALQALAASRLIADGDFAGFQRETSQVLPHLAGSSIVLANSSGQELTNTFLAYGNPLPRISPGSARSLETAFRTGKPAISDLFIGNQKDQPVVTIGVPVMLDDKVAYYLALAIHPERLAEILKRQHFPDDWVAAITDSTGTFVARTRNQAQFIGKKAAPLLLDQIADAQEGILEGVTQEGVSAVAGFSRSTVSGWTVGIAIPTAELMAPLYRSLWLTISAAAFVFLLALLIAWLIGARIGRSIRALSEPALAMAADSPVNVPPLGIREVNEVGGALLKASQELKERQIAHAKAEQQALRESEERLRHALGAAGMATFDRDMRTGSAIWSDEFYPMFGYRIGEVQPSRAAWLSRIHPEDREAANAVIVEAAGARRNFVNEFRIVLPDGKIRWLRSHGRFRCEGSDAISAFGIIEDVTEARQQIETQRVLVAELQHRTRNLMAVVQSIAHQTLDSADSLAEFESRFDSRLQALSRVQSLLSRSDNEPITVGTLVVMELEALGLEADNRITIGGPEAFLRKSVVEMLALALHELLTNAIKYGALASHGTGRLSVTWRIDGVPPDQQLVLEWIERGIAPSVLSPDLNRTGYGRTLIEQALPYSLSAETTFELGTDSLRCRISLPLTPQDAGDALA
jgi:PAS domain S-box-containing protein